MRIAASLALFFPLISIAAEPFGVLELRRSLAIASEDFLRTYKEPRYDSVTGLEVARGRAGSAKVALSYTENEAKKTAKYFCHYHGAAMDCHEE